MHFLAIVNRAKLNIAKQFTASTFGRNMIQPTIDLVKFGMGAPLAKKQGWRWMQLA